MLQIVKIDQTPVLADMFGGKANGLYLLKKNGGFGRKSGRVSG